MKKSPRKLLLSRETLLSLEIPAVGIAAGAAVLPGTLVIETGDSCCCTMAPICYNENSQIQVCFP